MLGLAELQACLKPWVAARSDDPALVWPPRLAQVYPGDLGALAPLYLHFVRLEPGEALFLPAGELHCYLHGVAVEVMAGSDNVLRGGLTSKPVDVDELMRIMTFAAAVQKRFTPATRRSSGCR